MNAPIPVPAALARPSAEAWREIFALLDTALELDPREHGAWLAALGPERAALAPWLEELLRTHADGADFLRDTATFALDRDAARTQPGRDQEIGPYRLLREIGQGGMAAVFRAHDLELAEDVALKVFAVQHTSDILVARFKQELKLSRQLQHPNVIRLYDLGMHEGHRYLSLELLVGQSLKERMEKPVDPRSALGLLIQACHGLQAAHDAGVVHRDVKPDNFFVTTDGVLKVMDFGIAKQFTSAPGLTVAGSIAGTPLYMSPEQIGNFSTVTHLTDLYALGVVAYELFTGTTPFAHEELVPLLMMHINENAQAPRVRNPALPPALDAAILRLLAKDPRARFQSCRELAQALTAIRDQSYG